MVVGVGVGATAADDREDALHARRCLTANGGEVGVTPFFENVTRNVAKRPGLRSGVFFPAILKSWETLPLLVTVKITVPVRALRFESVNLESVAVTVTRVVAIKWDVACDALALAAAAYREDSCGKPRHRDYCKSGRRFL